MGDVTVLVCRPKLPELKVVRKWKCIVCRQRFEAQDAWDAHQAESGHMVKNNAKK